MEAPEILVSKISPTAVYAQNVAVIEKILAPVLKDAYEVKHKVLSSICYEKMVKTRTIASATSNGNGNSKDAVPRANNYAHIVREITSNEEAAAVTERDPVKANKIKELREKFPATEITAEKLEADYKSVSAEDLISLTHFLSDDYAPIVSSKNAEKLPGIRVSTAFGIDKTLIEKSAKESDVLSLDRLGRAFRGTFILSPCAFTENCVKVLIRLDSGFMENIMLQRVHQSNYAPMHGVHFVRLNDETSKYDHQPRKPPQISDKSAAYYIEMQLDDVLGKLLDVYNRVVEVYNSSLDDVL